MFKTLKKRIKNEKGLSLVELLAVIVILGIISAIAVPAIGNIIANSQAKAEIADAVQILNSAKLYELDGNTIGAGGVNQTDTTLKTYVEVTDRIQEYTVTKDGSSYKIQFKGKQLADSVGPYTLDDLSKLKVKEGKIVTTSP